MNKERREYHRKWYKENRELILQRCKRCYQNHKEENREKGRKYYEKHKNDSSFREKQNIKAKAQYQKRKVEGKVQEYQNKVQDKRREYAKERRKKIKLQAFEILGGAKCANCGCDTFAFLEINHKNGGGNKESQKRFGKKLGLGLQICTDIVNGKVDDITKYEVLCRVCNALHYLHLKEPEQARRFDIKWNGD